MTTFSETRRPTSREYVASLGLMMQNLFQTVQCFWSHSSLFPLENYSKNLHFWNIFASKRTFGVYVLWNVCTHFWIICSWTTYSDAKFIAGTLTFMVALLRFCFRKIVSNMLNFQFFLLWKQPSVATLSKRVLSFPEDM